MALYIQLLLCLHFRAGPLIGQQGGSQQLLHVDIGSDKHCL
jgi:hypothetical protein